MKKCFKIGGFTFSVEYSEEISIPSDLMVFATEEEPVYSYKMFVDREFPKAVGQVLVKNEDLLVLNDDGREMRYIGVRGAEGYYACYREISACEALVFIDRLALKKIHLDPVFISLLALEKRLLQYEGIVLHCAYIEVNGQAVLFSAPSETGKTTQANLWKKYRGCETINGDRSLLKKVNGTWMAGGWPVCGTSEICRNLTLPISCIVMLSQAKENRGEKLGGMKAFSQVYSQVTINRWDKATLVKGMGLIEDLVATVPVYHLACDMSEDAVKCLEDMAGL